MFRGTEDLKHLEHPQKNKMEDLQEKPKKLGRGCLAFSNFDDLADARNGLL